MSDENASMYFEIHKKDTSDPEVRVKTMRHMKEKEYLRRTANSIKTPILKDRYSFVHNNQYFTLDVFRNLDLCLLEVEPTEANDRISLPSGLVVLDEVTDNPSYRNFSLFGQINQKGKGKIIK